MAERPQNASHHESKSLHKTDDYLCTLLFQQLEQSDLPDKSGLIQRLKNCTQYRHHGLNSGKKPNYCNLRYLCKACTDREAHRYALKYADRIIQLMTGFRLCPLFMTLRPNAGSDLVEQLFQLNNYLKKIQQQRSNYFHHSKRFTEFCRFQYALVFVEVIRTTDNQLWFPHVHAIVLNPISEPLFELQPLAREWETISGSTIPPHVKSTTAGDLFQDGIRSQAFTLKTKGAILNGLKKLVAYPLKMSSTNQPSLSPADLITVRSAISGGHRIREWMSPMIRSLTPTNKA